MYKLRDWLHSEIEINIMLHIAKTKVNRLGKKMQTGTGDTELHLQGMRISDLDNATSYTAIGDDVRE